MLISALLTLSTLFITPTDRMAWFREARFGMFIHWGLYAVPAGKWQGKEVQGAGEWILFSGQIKVKDYEPLQKQFNPVKFDAKEWVRIAKDAGMKYIVITSKHHDGFGLFHSKETDWDIAGTPFKRDVLKELASACKDGGIRLCFYHSIMDWHHPDYLPRRPWDPRPEHQANFENYVRYMKAQLKELLTNYGPIGILWFDGEWEGTWTHEHGKDLYSYVRSLQPDIIINNRVDKGRQGMAGLTKGDFMGDYGTPEQEIPGNGIPGVDWESCMTMNDTWGYKKSDHNWKSAETLITNLIDCASKGGNYLLNVGPTDLGEIPGASVERLKKVGDWMRLNGEAIYGTQAGPFSRRLSWGKVTRKGQTLYLCLTEGYRPKVEMPGLKLDVEAASYLGQRTRQLLKVDRNANGVTVELPESAKSLTIPVIALRFKGEPVVETIPIRPNAAGDVELLAVDATIEGHAQYEADKNCIGYWTDKETAVSWDFDLPAKANYTVVAILACEPKSEGSEVLFDVGAAKFQYKVEPTASWSDFKEVKLGTLELLPGKQKVRVLPLTKPGLAVMNLRGVYLRRSK
ncbi:MAG: hypothetical protein HONBIEJF_02491 [Fimbriimonadaceae bacterium]|nr:hypothetical protein [Fimbriimonadaceae bacterium]